MLLTANSMGWSSTWLLEAVFSVSPGLTLSSQHLCALPLLAPAWKGSNFSPCFAVLVLH